MLERVLNLLESVRKRPAMFFWPKDATALENFLAGVVCAYHVEGLPVTHDHRREAAEDRGWDFTSTGALGSMQAAGLSGEALLREQVAVAAEAFRRAGADRLPEHLALRYRQDDHLFFVESVCFRPLMYTLNGTLGEVFCFLEGWYSSGAAGKLDPAREEIWLQWDAFISWACERVAPGQPEEWRTVATALRESHPPDGEAVAALGELYREYRRSAESSDASRRLP